MGEKSRHMAFCILQNFPLLLIALFILNIVKIVNLGPWRFFSKLVQLLGY